MTQAFNSKGRDPMSVTHAYNHTEAANDSKAPVAAIEHATESNPVWQTLATRPLSLQAKLKVSQPGDAAEQEADHLAEQVMRMEVTSSTSNTLQSGEMYVQRMCSACEEEEEGLQRKEDGGGHSGESAPPIVHETLSSPGHPLDSETRASMESRFQHGFSNVRIHTGEQAARSAESVGALAYTVGSNIVFGQQRYAPHTSGGQKLLAHELAHVIQQTP